MITFIDKFNFTVSGTLFDSHDDTTTDSNRPTETKVTTLAQPTMVELTTETPIFVLGGALFYTVVGIAGGIVVFTFGFIIVCVLIGFSVRRNRKSHGTLTTAYITHHDTDPQHSVPVEPTYDTIQEESPHTVIGTPSHFSHNPAYVHLGVGVKETRFESDSTLYCDSCSHNPAYGIHP